MSDVIIGIDLGTTNSEVAVIQDGKVIIIEDNHTKILPSFVGIGDNDEILIGEAAKNQYALYPERTIKSIKRRMGEDTSINMGDKTFTPQEISAIILKRLKTIAENYLGHPVEKAVITVPAYFSDAQRQATRDAGEIAGLDVVRMINEPTAAALSYEAQQKSHKKVLVYDLGGGTFDVSVVSIEDDVVEVLASHGNNHLGGDDFDEKIVDYIVKHIQDKENFDISESNKVIARISRAAEKAKRSLSTQPYVILEEEYLCEKDGTPIHLSLEFPRIDYENLIESYIDETLNAVHIALKDAHLTVADIDEILLVGGSTRTPIVNDRLYKEFGIEPHKEIDPDLCVVTGAAIQAAMIAGQDIASAVLVDVTPYTFGMSYMGSLNGEPYPHLFAPIIHKNSALPMNKTEAFYTMYDGQEKVEITVYQGEDSDALNNIQIGEFLIEGLNKKAPSNNVVTVQFTLDLDGLLKVFAKEKSTGLEKSITITNALSSYDEFELDSAKQRIDALFSDENPIDNSNKIHHDIVKAKALVEKAQLKIADVSDEDKEDMGDFIEQINTAIKDDDLDILAVATESLADILYYLDE